MKEKKGINYLEYMMTLTLVFNALFSIKALQVTGVALYLASRRCLVIMILGFNILEGKYEEVTKTKIVSAALIVSGTIYAAVCNLI